MKSISEYLTAEHRHCDVLFAEAEAVLTESDTTAAQEAFRIFNKEMESHLQKEENIMFPIFEEGSGSYMSGPTRIMRMEHGQMRRLFEDIEAALDKKDVSTCAGLLETLLMVMQQHNIKEEQMLYQMADNMLESHEDILRQMMA